MADTIIRIYRERIPHTDPRLRRHIHRDSRDPLFPFKCVPGTQIKSVLWQRQIPILDQGSVGSCTADAGTGCLGTLPFNSPASVAAYQAAFGTFDQAGAYNLYDAEETIDGDGPYPPNDNGSSGLTCCQALRAAGCISGWTNPVTIDDVLLALQQGPVIVGTYWYDSMMGTDSDGLLSVIPGSGIAGGHETLWRGYDVPGDELFGDNSWGPSFGVSGSMRMRRTDMAALLEAQGDAKQFVAAAA